MFTEKEFKVLGEWIAKQTSEENVNISIGRGMGGKMMITLEDSKQIIVQYLENIL